MKKYTALILVLLLVLSTFACGKKAEPEATSAPVDAPAQTEAASEPTEEPAPEPEPTEEPAPEPEPTEEPAPQWPDTIADVWLITLLEEMGVAMNPADFGMEGSFTFDGEGEVVIRMTGEEDFDTTYTVSGNTVTIMDTTGEIVGMYDADADAIALEQDGIRMILERKSNVSGKPEPTPTEPVAITEAEAVGTWTFVMARMGSTEVPASVLEQEEMAFVFDTDGNVTCKTDGETYGGMVWKIVEGVLAVYSEDGEPIYEFTYDGTYLGVQEPETGVTMLFEKQAEVKMELYADEYGQQMVTLSFVLPAGATVRIAFPSQDDYTHTNTSEKTEYRKVKMPAEIFLGDEPFTGDETEITPRVIITTADGKEIPVDCPSFVYPVRLPSITFSWIEMNRIPNGEFHAQAGDNGLYVLSAAVSDPNASVTINGAEVPMNEDGMITYDLAVVDGAPTYYELTVKAENNNVTYITDLTIVVDP